MMANMFIYMHTVIKNRVGGIKGCSWSDEKEQEALEIHIYCFM